MNLRDIRTGEMLAVTYSLLDDTGKLRVILESDERLKGPLEELQKAHDQLLETQQRTGTNEEEIKRLTDEMTQLDREHDRLSSAIYDVVAGCTALADTPEEARTFETLQTTLHPQGRGIVRRSYREQAGTAKQVRDRLSGEQRALLASIDVGGTTLDDKVERWLDAALGIAKMESERAQLRRDTQDDGVSLSEVRDARLDWMSAIRYLASSLEFAEISESQQGALLANIEEASSRARRRSTSSSEDTEAPVSEVDEAPEEEPSPDEEPAMEDEPADVVEPAE